MIPAKQKPSKKRRVMNIGTLTEKATIMPKINMKMTDRIRTGCLPNLSVRKDKTRPIYKTAYSSVPQPDFNLYYMCHIKLRHQASQHSGIVYCTKAIKQVLKATGHSKKLNFFLKSTKGEIRKQVLNDPFKMLRLKCIIIIMNCTGPITL